MSTTERLQIMETPLWDSLLYEETEIESPEWYRDILEERKPSTLIGIDPGLLR